MVKDDTLTAVSPRSRSTSDRQDQGPALADEARTCVSLWYTLLAMRFWGCRSGGWVWGTAMDSTALHELIAQVRGTAAALAEAEQRVASFTAELAQQDRLAQPDAKPAQQIRTPIAKRGTSGWVPAG